MLSKFIVAASFVLAASASAQTISGTQVVLAANGEVTRPNDQADATFYVEEQDKDKAAAASRVNAKMKEGMEVLKKADPSAQLKSYGYYTYAVYPDERPNPQGQPVKRVPVGWRVGQYVNLRTQQLEGLPKLVAAAQKTLALQNLHFGLSPAAAKALDAERIAAAYADFQNQVAAVAKAMGRKASDAQVELLDYEGSGRYGGNEAAPQRMMITGSALRKSDMDVAEPSFEPGETTLNLRMVAKVRFQ